MTRSPLVGQIRPPRVRLAPRAVESDADDAITLAAAYGLTPFRWQEDVLESWLGRRADGRWAAATCGLAVPRQNGKNAVIEVREFYGAAVLGERIIHTAHQVKTAREAFIRVASFFEDDRHPEIKALVKEVRRANGQEAVTLRNGGQIRFIARSGPSGRGMSIDTLILDEAQDLTEEELGALQPMMSTSSNPQLILTGTPPDPDRTAGHGDAFGRIRAAGEAQRDARLAWTDFGVPDGALPNINDRDLWLSCNPSLVEGLISPDNIEAELALMAPETFARERLGWWGDPQDGADRVVPAAAWESALDADSFIATSPVFALDVSPTRSWAALAVAGRRADDRWHVELTSRSGVIDVREGTAWVLGRLRQLAESFPRLSLAIARGSAAEAMVPAIEQLGISVTVIGDLGAACGFFYDRAVDETLHHLGQPELNRALFAATRRDIGDNSFVWWRRKSASDISPLYAVTLALWLAEQESAQRERAINNIW